MAEPEFLQDMAALEAIYGTPGPTSLAKVADHLTPVYDRFVAASRFCILSTIGPEGTDATPRGEDGPVVTKLDDRRLLLPDWAGNNRIDSLRNILRDDRLSLMFLVPGADNVVRINGRGRITADEGLRQRFERNGKLPRTVLLVEIAEVYFQCAKAVLRSGLWNGESPDVPTAGDMLKEMTKGEHGGAGYDRAYPERAKQQLW
jgi:uncharacterized protein